MQLLGSASLLAGILSKSKQSQGIVRQNSCMTSSSLSPSSFSSGLMPVFVTALGWGIAIINLGKVEQISSVSSVPQRESVGFKGCSTLPKSGRFHRVQQLNQTAQAAIVLIENSLNCIPYQIVLDDEECFNACQL